MADGRTPGHWPSLGADGLLVRRRTSAREMRTLLRLVAPTERKVPQHQATGRTVGHTGWIAACWLCLALCAPSGLAWCQDRASVTETDELRLSDVRIYGKRKVEFIVLGEKRALAQSSGFPVLLATRTRRAGDVDQAIAVSAKRITDEPATRTADNLWSFGAEIGSFLAHAIDLKFGNRVKTASFVLSLLHRMGDGHVEGSAYRADLAGAQGTLVRSQHTKLGLGLQFDDRAYELWGSPTQPERKRRGYGGTADLSLFSSESADLSFRVGLQHLEASDGGGARATESLWEAQASFESLWKGNLVGSLLRLEGSSLEQDAGNRSGRLIALGLSGRRVFGPLGVLLGLNVFRARDYDRTDETQVYPRAELACSVTQGARLRVFYHPEMLAPSFVAAQEADPFTELNASFPVRDRRVAGGAEIRLQWRSGLTTTILAQHEEVEDFPVWVDPDGDGLWEVERDRAVQGRSLRVASAWEPGGRFRWEGSVSLQDIEFLSLAPGDPAREVPYEPSFLFNGRMEASLWAGILLQPGIQHTGKRFASLSGDGLDPFTLVNVEISRRWGKHLRLLAGGKNLLDEDYALWQGYVMPGRTGYVGLEGRW